MKELIARFLPNLLPAVGAFLNPWVLLALTLAGASLFGYGLHIGNQRLESYQIAVKAVGKVQEANTKRIIAENKSRKEKADASNTKLVADNAALNKQLRNERARRGYVPAAAPGAKSPNTAKVNRAELERAIQRLDERVSGIVAQCDKGRIDLDTAKDWAQEK